MAQSSLKGYIPGLAQHLGLSPAALYERQRALVRAGLLEPRVGWGPGSGVSADSRNIAILIIAALATDSLSDTEWRVKEIAMARPLVKWTKRWGSKLTRRESLEARAIEDDETLLDEIEYLLVNSSKAMDLKKITVSRTSALASLTFGRALRWANEPPDDSLTTHSFVGTNDDLWVEPRIEITAELKGQIIKNIGDDIKAMTSFSDDF